MEIAAARQPRQQLIRLRLEMGNGPGRGHFLVRHGDRSLLKRDDPDRRLIDRPTALNMAEYDGACHQA
jgi:hypothetical protein